jgi:hydroxypyruvate reductase
MPSFELHRVHIEQMIAAALAAADPAVAVRNHLRLDGQRLWVGKAPAAWRYELGRGRIFVVAMGKAAVPMGRAALQILQGEVAEAIFIGKQGERGVGRRYRANVGSGAPVTVFEAGHPVSDETGVRATAAVLAMLEQTRPGDLMLCLISGGASALLTQPVLTLAEWQQLTGVLLDSGCTIHELNSVRKQLDRVKGGGLAQAAAPATVAALVLSDVVGNRLDIIGSGPTAPDPESPAAALSVLHRYNVSARLAPETWKVITTYLTDRHNATSVARFGDMDVVNLIVGDVGTAVQAAAAEAGRLGLSAQPLTCHLQGEAREVGRVLAALAIDAPPGCCLLLGGETTVTVTGDGRGGRNQELALAAALALEGAQNVALATFASDGEDGTTPAAGAVITGETAPRARALGLHPRAALENNDSYGFFNALFLAGEPDPLLRPGPTGTNVNDLVFILRY